MSLSSRLKLSILSKTKMATKTRGQSLARQPKVTDSCPSPLKKGRQVSMCILLQPSPSYPWCPTSSQPRSRSSPSSSQHATSSDLMSLLLPVQKLMFSIPSLMSLLLPAQKPMFPLLSLTFPLLLPTCHLERPSLFFHLPPALLSLAVPPQ